MGNYNPHAPYILGEEWVPIRDENAIFSPAVNSVELGHRFYTGGGTLTTARFYINELQPLSDRGQTFMAAIYPTGLEDQSGPIEKLLVPCNAATLTSATTSGAATAVDALLTQSTSSGISLDCSQPNTGLALSFGLSTYYPVLSGKRILGANLLIGTSASDDIVGPTSNTNTSTIKLSTTITIGSTTNPEAVFGNLRLNNVIDRIPLGEINQFWTANSPNVIADRVPWTYAQLTRMDAVATRIYTRIESGTNRGTTANSSCYVFYVALEIIYCEEQRIIVGATQFGTSNASHSFGAESVLGANQILMHDMSGNLNPALAAGDYVLMLSSADVGALNGNQAQLTSDYPNLNAVRELYSIPSHPGVEVDIPFPLIDHIGEVLTSSQTEILPQISLHTAAGTLTDTHVYGRQLAAQVYGVNTATQDIYDGASGVAGSYPQVRFYARRFGDTTVPLTLGGGPGGMLLPGIAGSYASTPDNAALDIVGDIDLRFDGTIDWTPAAPPSLIAKWNEATNNRSYLLALQADGTLFFGWSANGIAVAGGDISTVAVPIANEGRLAVRVTLDVDNGAAGHTTTFYTAPTIAGPWTQLGAPIVTAGVTSIFSGTALGEVGAHTAGTMSPLTGIVHAAAILNGIAGTEVANPNFAAQSPGTTVFVDAAGRTWTLNGTAAIVGGLGSSSVSITPGDFDELVEILDGWKEITLRFSTAPTMGTLTDPVSWTWSATSETAGNRWEILGASAPAISGIPVNLFNQVPSPNQLSGGTYQPTSGATVNLDWLPQGIASPYVANVATDQASDAVLIFSQDPWTVTGVSLTARAQTVTGFALDCGTLPCCIPSGISYQQLSWSLPSINALVIPGPTGGYASTPDNATLDIVGDMELIADVALNDWVSGAFQTLIGKWTETTQQSYRLGVGSTGLLQFAWSTAGNNPVGVGSTAAPIPDPVTGRLAVRATMDVNNGAGGNTVTFYTAPTAAGPWTQLGAAVITGGVTSIFSGTAILEVGSNSVGTGNVMAGKVYSAQVINGLGGAAVANPNFAAQAAGTTSFVDAAGRTWTINSPAAIQSFSVPVSSIAGLELQRFDAYNASGDFETIMLSTDPTITSFNDYEARVGITSVYRIRALNALNFAGQWSTYVSGAPPVPGVTVGPCGDGTGALIFTSNADQTGHNNAAYVMQWENTPTEDFQLPEADMVIYQPVYGRDGSIAFHGTERGLETFDRVVLLHAAAIDPIRLADARTIRDLAWANLPYVCVRDELGDRWFASVRVPSVNARLNRTKYMARIEIVETTETPYPVDP